MPGGWAWAAWGNKAIADQGGAVVLDDGAAASSVMVQWFHWWWRCGLAGNDILLATAGVCYTPHPHLVQPTSCDFCSCLLHPAPTTPTLSSPHPVIFVPVCYTLPPPPPPCPAHILWFLFLSVTHRPHPVQPTSCDFCPCLLPPTPTTPNLSSPHPVISVPVCYPPPPPPTNILSFLSLLTPPPHPPDNILCFLFLLHPPPPPQLISCDFCSCYTPHPVIYVPLSVHPPHYTPPPPPPPPAISVPVTPPHLMISVPVYYTYPPCPAHILGFLSLSVTPPRTLSSPHPGISVTVCYTHKCLFVHKHLCDDTCLIARWLLKQGHIPPAKGGNQACSVTQTHSVLHRNTWIPTAMEVKQYSKSWLLASSSLIMTSLILFFSLSQTQPKKSTTKNQNKKSTKTRKKKD